MSIPVTGDSTNVVQYFQLRLSATGKAATGLTITGIDLQYTRDLTAAATKTDAIVGTGGAATHVDNKVFEIDATSSPGLYMACFADAAYAAGVPKVTLTLKEATIFSTSMTVGINVPVGSVTGAVGSVTGNVGGDIVGNLDGTVATLTTYTGNTLQTGDVITAINDLANATDGLTALKATIDLQATLAICTETRLAELDAGNLPTDIAAIPTTAMRGTDNAALASVLGAIDDTASAGDPTALETALQYLKQLVNTLEGTAGIPVLLAAQDPANNISLAEMIRKIFDNLVVADTAIDAIPTTAMRGTDSAALATALATAQLDLDKITGTNGVLLSSAQVQAWASKIEASAGTIIEVAAKAGTLSTTQMSTTMANVDNAVNGRVLIFKSDTTTAALRGQATDITDFANTNGVLTFTALTTAPAATDTAVIV